MAFDEVAQQAIGIVGDHVLIAHSLLSARPSAGGESLAWLNLGSHLYADIYYII